MLIGSLEIIFPDEHQVPFYYKVIETYGYGPWNFLFRKLNEMEIQDPQLLDVGANVGDSAAHFREHSNGHISSIEANPYFFNYLTQNAKKIKNMKCLLGAFVTNKQERLTFIFGSSTGTKANSYESESEYKLSKFDLIDCLNTVDSTKPLVIKSDLDGWDIEFLKALVNEPHKIRTCVAIFSEGPSEEQILSGRWHDFLEVIKDYTESAWDCYLFTNRGELFLERVENSALISVFTKMEEELPNNSAPAHFFDFVLLRKEIGKTQ
jgi:FkbM family methyltransferase